MANEVATTAKRRPSQTTVDTMNTLLRRADEGDPRAVSQLREMLGEVPAVWDELGDMARQAEDSLIRVAAGKNELTQEAIGRKLRALRREIAGPDPAPLERLLVERIAACWLHLHYVEGVYYQNMKGQTIAQADYHQRQIDHAQRRYLAAIRALAQVRRLDLPAVQLNIAEKQVNVMQGTGDGLAARESLPAPGRAGEH